MSHKPTEVARCPGIPTYKNVWVLQCGACLRRTSQSKDYLPWIQPPKFEQECPERVIK